MAANKKLGKLEKVSDSFTVNRYDNGFMVEVSGKDKKDDWTSVKVVCNSEEEVIALIKEYNALELDR
jgi:hypothetical protein